MTVDWSFLFDIMAAMGFPQQFIGWVATSVTIARFSVFINGELQGNFKGERGLSRGILFPHICF